MDNKEEPVPAPEPEQNLQESPAEPPRTVDIREADVSVRYEDVFEEISPDEVVSVGWKADAYEFACKNGVCLRIQVIAPGIVRLRYSPDGYFAPDHSYALPPDFSPEKVKATLSERANEYLLVCDPLQLVVAKSGARVRF